jgi:hypothetical protein
MNIHLTDRSEWLSAAEIERLATATTPAASTSVSSDACDTPTLVPPSDDSPPTVRWTPPPILLAFSQCGGTGADRRR